LPRDIYANNTTLFPRVVKWVAELGIT